MSPGRLQMEEAGVAKGGKIRSCVVTYEFEMSVPGIQGKGSE
jgi:hypothetical protein